MKKGLRQAEKFIEKLSLDPLVAMFLSIHYCRMTAQTSTTGFLRWPSKSDREVMLGDGVIAWGYIDINGALTDCFDEGVLRFGPSFVFDIFRNHSRGEMYVSHHP